MTNQPHSTRVLTTVGVGFGAGSLVVFGLFFSRLLSGDPTYFAENLTYLLLWAAPYLLLLAPVAWIPLPAVIARWYGYGAILIGAGIALPHLYVLSLPKTPTYSEAGLLLIETLVAGGTAYVLLWLVLGVVASVSK